MLLHGGRPVPGFALGAGATFAQAATDLQNEVVLVVQSAGDSYYSANVKNLVLDFSDATEAYQAAGQAGATSVGPEIDSVGAPSVTKPLTQQAWVVNGQLATLPKSGLPDPKNDVSAPYYNQSDADEAKSLVSQMIDLYYQAINAGSAALKQPSPLKPSPSKPRPSPKPGPPTPVPPPAQAASSNFWPVVAVGVAAAAVTFVVAKSKLKMRRSSHA